MKQIILVLIMVSQVLAFDKQDTLKISSNSYTVMNYINSNYNDMMILVSTDYYQNGKIKQTTQVWGDSINLNLLDSITTIYYEGYHYVFTWRNGSTINQILQYDTAVVLNVANDKRIVVKKSSETNIVKFDRYELRIFCGRIVELYYLNSAKVYSVYTETNCSEPVIEKEPVDTTPKYLNPIG